jgi:hypothetical protein
MRCQLLIRILAAELAAGSVVYAQSGQIRVTTDPPGAVVICDGRMQEDSPVTITNLEPGLHLLVIRKEGFQEYRQSPTVPAGQRVGVEIKLEPITGLALLQSVPPEVNVEIDGAHRGTTPLLLTDLPLGRYRVAASAPGYVPREMQLVLEDRTPREMNITLMPDSGTLTVETEPAGAAVTVNGAARGTTPCVIESVPTGDARMEIRLSGYNPHRQDIRMLAGQQQTIRLALTPAPAELNVTSVPEGARVYADDQYVGQAPVVLDRLAAGPHTVRLELRGYETESRAVEVKQGESTTEEFKLARNSGSLEIKTEPAGVKVVVDGEEVGTTTARETDAVSEILRVDFLFKGEHKMQLSKKGYLTIEKTILLEPTKTVTLYERLKRKFVPDTLIRTGTGPSDLYTGVVSSRQPNGDVVLETKPGIFLTIKASDIKAEERFAPPPD